MLIKTEEKDCVYVTPNTKPSFHATQVAAQANAIRHNKGTFTYMDKEFFLGLLKKLDSSKLIFFSKFDN